MASLRARLIAVLLAVAAVGLLVLAAVTYAEQRSFLLERVDQQLAGAPPAMERVLTEGFRPEPDHRDGDRPPPGADLPPGTYGELRDRNGDLIGQPQEFSLFEQRTQRLALPADLPLNRNETVSANGKDYRVRATEARVPGATLVVAIPLAETDEVLDRLLRVEALVIAGVLLVLGIAAAWLVRLGLRPLDRMGTTARVIAGGDLGRRVSPATPRTEVGAARPRAQRDARPARGRVRQAPGVRGPAAPVPVGRLARAAHAARLDPRLRRAAPDGRRERAGGGRAGDAPDRVRGGPDGRPGRGPAGAGAARRAARAGAPPGRRREPRARRGRRRARDRARPNVRAARGARHRGARRRAPVAPGARQPAAQRDRPHARGHAGRGDGRDRRGRRPDRRARPRPGPADRRRRRAVRPLLARRARARARQGGRGPRAGDRGRHRRGAPGPRRMPRTRRAAGRDSPCCCPRRRSIRPARVRSRGRRS